MAILNPAGTVFIAFPRTTIGAARRHSLTIGRRWNAMLFAAASFVKTYTASSLEEFEDESETALCPYCGADSVIGSASGFPIADANFIRAVHDRWFG